MLRQHTRAPRRTPLSPTAMLPSPGIRRRSTSMLGAASRKARTGIRLCPPAIRVASGSETSRPIASRSVVGAWYSNGAGFIPLPRKARQLKSELMAQAPRVPAQDGGTYIAMSQPVLLSGTGVGRTVSLHHLMHRIMPKQMHLALDVPGPGGDGMGDARIMGWPPLPRYRPFRLHRAGSPSADCSGDRAPRAGSCSAIRHAA